MSYTNTLTFHMKGGVKPKFGEFQLLGDSIFLRFAKIALQQRPENTPVPSSLGFCVSGQRINQLRRKIKEKEYVLSSKVMILVGTNDVLCGSGLATMIQHFRKLLSLLRSRSVLEMVILTVPPVPKLALTTEHWEVVRGFNQFLLSLESPPDKVRVLDITSVFLKHDCPILAAPPTLKRKIDYKDSVSGVSEYPRKTLKLSENYVDSSDEENDGKFRTLVCRYLNRVNKQEALKEDDSSDDDVSAKQLPCFIDYKFWRRLQLQLPDESKKPKSSLHHDDPISSFNSSMNEKGGNAPRQNSVPVSEKIKNVFEYTNRFIRLDYYEKFYPSLNTRVDMIHPNASGLNALKKFIRESEVM